MRVLIDIPKQHVEALSEIGREKGVSRAAVIRTMVEEYLKESRKDVIQAAFGLWKDHPVDALEHQRRLRDEW